MSDKQTVQWGVLGTARIADKVGAAIQQSEAGELTAVASRSIERAAVWASQRKVPRSYGSYQALLDDPELDAVYIPLPPSLHHEWTIRAAQQGKHVLCEKPLALNATEAEEMAAACREHNVQLMDGVMWVHHPRATDMRAVIQGGTLGQLRRVTSAFSFNWDEIPTGDLRLQRSLGGGALLDLGWYCARASLFAFGDLPLRVLGTGRYYNDVDMNFSAMMWYAGERMASFDCGFDTEMRRWFEVAGNRASMVCDDFTKPWHADKVRFWLHNRDGLLAERACATPIQEVCMIEAFCEVVRSGQLNEDWPRDAIQTQRLCDALDQSARIEAVVELV